MHECAAGVSDTASTMKQKLDRNKNEGNGGKSPIPPRNRGAKGIEAPYASLVGAPCVPLQFAFNLSLCHPPSSRDRETP